MRKIGIGSWFGLLRRRARSRNERLTDLAAAVVSGTATVAEFAAPPA